MPFVQLSEIEEKEVVPGFHARFVHGENMTTAYWRVDAGAVLPEHAHLHEQVSTVVEGQFEMTLDGETRLLDSGTVAVIPPNVTHAGRAITPCRIVDVFYPIREDYR